MWWFCPLYPLRVFKALAQIENVEEGRRKLNIVFMETVWMWNMQKALSLCLQIQREKVPSCWCWCTRREKVSLARVAHIRKEFFSYGPFDHAWCSNVKLQAWKRPWVGRESQWHICEQMPCYSKVRFVRALFLFGGQSLEVWNIGSRKIGNRARSKPNLSCTNRKKCHLFYCEANGFQPKPSKEWCC